MLTFPSASVIVRLLWHIASLVEFASDVPLRPLITFHISFLPVLNMAPSSTSFQHSFLTWFMAPLASLHSSIHSSRLVLMVPRNRLRVCILAHKRGVIQGSAFQQDFVFPTCVSATEFKMLVNLAKHFDRFDSAWRYVISSSTSLLNFSKSTPFLCHFGLHGRTGW